VTAAEPIIRLAGVTKRFGRTVAVDDVTIDVPRGRCLGWLGPNGSGKTTLIRCMLGLARVSAGTIHVRGREVPKDVRWALASVGAIVEEPRFYPYLSGRRNLEVSAGFVGREAFGRIDGALERVDLTRSAALAVKKYSLGMRQRLGVARSLLTDPELLILDEPSNGLDPAGMAEFRQMIRSFVEHDGRTVFISSHLLDEVEKIADDIAIVQAGALVVHGTVAELVAGGEATVRMRVDEPGRARAVLGDLRFVIAVDERGARTLDVRLERVDDESSMALTRALVEAGIGVAEVAQRRESLEERFLEITGGQSDPRAEEEVEGA
jgi:ABC-2 type transport system ATP-binding protein